MPVATRQGHLGTRATVPRADIAPPENTPPLPPSNFQSTATTQTTVDLAWDPGTDVGGSGLAGYNLYQVVAGLDTLIATPTISPHQVTDLTAGTSYTFRLATRDGAGNLSTLVSTGASTQAPLDTTPPSDPTNFNSGVITPTAIPLMWTASTDAESGVGGYEVFRDVNGTDVLVQTVSNTDYTAVGLTPSTTYTHRIQAFDNAGNRSNKVSRVDSTPSAADTVAPSVPPNLSAGFITSDSLLLNWDDSTDNVGVTGYIVYQAGQFVDIEIGTTTTATSFNVTGLGANQTKTFRVKARDAAGNLSNPAAVTATTLPSADTTPPTVPGNFRQTNITQSSVTLAWNASTDAGSGVAGYDIYQGVGLLISVTGTSYTVPNLLPGTSYAFNIQARDVAGNLSAFAGAITINTSPAVAESWPMQSITGAWGMTINHQYLTVGKMDEFYNALPVAGQNDFEWSRFQIAWPNLDPDGDGDVLTNPGGYNWNAFDTKIAWLKARDIRPIVLLTFTPPSLAQQITATANRTVGAKIYFTNLVTGAYNGIHLRGNNIPDNTIVLDNGGTDANGRFLTMNKLATTNTTGSWTVTFGVGGTPTAGNNEDTQIWPDPDHYIDLAKAAVAICDRYKTYNIALEYYNEANASGYSNPGIDANGGVQAWCNAFRWIYRAVKEYDPSIPVLSTGVANLTSTGPQQVDAMEWNRRMWREMKADTTWNNRSGGGWIDATASVIGASGASGFFNYSMRNLKTAGIIDDDFFVDWAGHHQYLGHRVGNQANANNYKYWHNMTDANGANARWIVMLNDCQIEDPTTLTFTGSPTGGTFRLGVNVYNDNSPLAQTPGTTQVTANITYSTNSATTASNIDTAISNLGAVPDTSVRVQAISATKFKIYFEGSLAGTSYNISTNVEVTKNTDALTPAAADFTVEKRGLNRIKFASTESGIAHHPEAITGQGWRPGTSAFFAHTASEEEAYISFTSVKRTVKKDLAYPTGGGIPAKLGTWDPRDRWSVFNIQWIKEAGGAGYTPVPDVFTHTGFITKDAFGGTPADTLKRKAGTARHANLTTPFPVGTWGAGNDGVDAFGAVWD